MQSVSFTDRLLSDLQTLSRIPNQRIYAVMDGARFNDLPDLLEEHGLSFRSLYLKDTDQDHILTGAFLIDPYHLAPEEKEFDLSVFDDLDDDDLSQENLLRRAARYQAIVDEAFARGDETGGGLIPPEPKPRPVSDPLPQLEKVVSLVGDMSAVVFWIGDRTLTEEALWKHLRTINRVSIPQAYASPEMSAEELEKAENYETVLFRHADGNVLAPLMPEMDAAQFARLFGPASILLFPAPDHPSWSGSIIRKAMKPEGAVADAGLLQFDTEQLAIVSQDTVRALNEKIFAYLEEHHPHSSEGETISLEWVKSMRPLIKTHYDFHSDQHLLDLCTLLWCHGRNVTHEVLFQRIINRQSASREDKCRQLLTAYPINREMS